SVAPIRNERREGGDMGGMLARVLLGESVAPRRDDRRQLSQPIFQVRSDSWGALIVDGVFNQTFMTGADFAKWLSGEESRHRPLMQEAGFLAGNGLHFNRRPRSPSAHACAPLAGTCDKISHTHCAVVLWKARKFVVVSMRSLLQRSGAGLLPTLCNTL